MVALVYITSVRAWGPLGSPGNTVGSTERAPYLTGSLIFPPSHPLRLKRWESILSSMRQHQPLCHCYPLAPGLPSGVHTVSLKPTSCDRPLNTQSRAQQTRSTEIFPCPGSIRPGFTGQQPLLSAYSSLTFSFLIGINNWTTVQKRPSWPRDSRLIPGRDCFPPQDSPLPLSGSVQGGHPACPFLP